LANVKSLDIILSNEITIYFITPKFLMYFS
jgi:hypothetical protein